MSRIADLAVGATLGALGASQGIAMPGMVLVGLGYDATIATVRAVNPTWFPNSEPLTLGDVLVTAIGTAIGWTVLNALMPPRENPYSGTGAQLPLVAAGLASLAIPGRIPGRLPIVSTPAAAVRNPVRYSRSGRSRTR